LQKVKTKLGEAQASGDRESTKKLLEELLKLVPELNDTFADAQQPATALEQRINELAEEERHAELAKQSKSAVSKPPASRLIYRAEAEVSIADIERPMRTGQVKTRTMTADVFQSGQMKTGTMTADVDQSGQMKTMLADVDQKGFTHVTVWFGTNRKKKLSRQGFENGRPRLRPGVVEVLPMEGVSYGKVTVKVRVYDRRLSAVKILDKTFNPNYAAMLFAAIS
jgi:hypothetical protein